MRLLDLRSEVNDEYHFDEERYMKLSKEFPGGNIFFGGTFA